MNFKPSKQYFKNEFLPKLQLGQLYEKKAQLRIMKYFNNNFELKKECHNSEYDFELSNNLKYEVKLDMRARDTDNIFIEFLQFNKTSGINITQADYYIIIIPHNVELYLLISVLELQFLIATYQFSRIIQPNKYNNFTAGYIFDVDTIIKHSILI